jgi:hypothetical protein
MPEFPPQYEPVLNDYQIFIRKTQPLNAWI